MPAQHRDAAVAGASVQSSAADAMEVEPVIAIRKPTQIRPKQPGKRVVVVPENYWDMVADYERHLRATNHADNTVSVYGIGLKELADYLTQEGIGLHIESIQRAHVQGFMRDIMERRQLKASTAQTRYNALHAFFNWLVEEGEIDLSPMHRMHKPKVIREPKSIITDNQLARLLRTCAGRDFYDRRDSAMIRVLLDTGLRRSGLADMRLATLDIEGGLCRITSKRKTWVVSFNGRTVDALAAYLRARKKHPQAERQELWLSQFGALNVRSINGIIERRCVQAQIPKIKPHDFRHTFAHIWLADGGQEGDLMELGGWASADMIHEVYARGTAHDRAIAAHKNKRLGDRV